MTPTTRRSPTAKGPSPAIFDLIPDLTAQVHSWGATESGVIIDFTLSGTAGGAPISWPAVDRIAIGEDGLATERVSYFDSPAADLSRSPAAPGSGRASCAAGSRRALSTPCSVALGDEEGGADRRFGDALGPVGTSCSGSRTRPCVRGLRRRLSTATRRTAALCKLIAKRVGVAPSPGQRPCAGRSRRDKLVRVDWESTRPTLRSGAGGEDGATIGAKPHGRYVVCGPALRLSGLWAGEGDRRLGSRVRSCSDGSRAGRGGGCSTRRCGRTG